LWLRVDDLSELPRAGAGVVFQLVQHVGAAAPARHHIVRADSSRAQVVGAPRRG